MGVFGTGSMGHRGMGISQGYRGIGHMGDGYRGMGHTRSCVPLDPTLTPSQC